MQDEDLEASLKRMISEDKILWPDIAALHGLQLSSESIDVNVNQWYVSKYLLWICSLSFFYCFFRKYNVCLWESENFNCRSIKEPMGILFCKSEKDLNLLL